MDAARSLKRRAEPSSGVSSTEEMSITLLGAGNEVGRSCAILRYKGKTIMVRLADFVSLFSWPDTAFVASTSSLYVLIAQFDCGVQPSETGIRALPFLDYVEPSEVDIIFISCVLPHFSLRLPIFFV